MKTSRAILILLLLLSGAFALATTLQPRTLHWTNHSPADSVLELLFGDSRRMFANHFFVKADISFHSGYYPSIFDEARRAEESDKDVAHPDEQGDQPPEGGFLGAPTDWIDRFSRHFRPTVHTHLQGENTREILPWLRISAELDPHRIETYIVAAYWLRERLNKVDDAEQFLREGLRANPNAPELLYELGRLDYENRKDFPRAKNVWLLALRRWHEVEQPKAEPDKLLLAELLGGLARLETHDGHFNEAIEYLEQLKELTPSPEQIQKQIDALAAKISAPK